MGEDGKRVHAPVRGDGRGSWPKASRVADIAEQVGEHDTRLWRFIRHYVDEARLYEDYTGVEAIGIDETSRKGHRYITVVADLVGAQT